MSLLNELKEFDAFVNSERNKIIDRIKEKILSLPDNNKIERLSTSVFIMNSGDLLPKSWSPEFYDFKSQYQLIVDVLSEYNGNIHDRLNKIISGEKIVINSYSFGIKFPVTYHLHPEVVAYLKTIL